MINAINTICALLESLNDNLGLVTLLAGTSAIYLYRRKKFDDKRDAAKIILQEIRRADDIISGYKEHGNFQFTKKIIANNSWGKNIHLFVGDLEPDEMDKISTLYSTGEFLDYLIKRISDCNFDKEVENFKKQSEAKNSKNSLPPIPHEVFRNPISEAVLRDYEFIYNSKTTEKLKKIAKFK
jgi:hypothetical protein